MMVRCGCGEPPAEPDLTGKLAEGTELLLCISVPSLQQEFCVSLLDTGESLIPKTTSLMPKTVPRPSSCCHGKRLGISSDLITLIKCSPYNVKTTCWPVMGDENSTALLAQLSCLNSETLYTHGWIPQQAGTAVSTAVVLISTSLTSWHHSHSMLGTKRSRHTSNTTPAAEQQTWGSFKCCFSAKARKGCIWPLTYVNVSHAAGSLRDTGLLWQTALLLNDRPRIWSTLV